MLKAPPTDGAFIASNGFYLLERCTDLFRRSPGMNQCVHRYPVRPVQERVPTSVGVAGLAYQCLPQWMMAGYQVGIPCVQPGQVSRLRCSSQLTHIADLAG